MRGFLPFNLILQKMVSESLDEEICSEHRVFLMAIRTPPPLLGLSLRYMSYSSSISSLFLWSPGVSHDSVPIMMSAFDSTARWLSSGRLFQRLWKLMIRVLRLELWSISLYLPFENDLGVDARMWVGGCFGGGVLGVLVGFGFFGVWGVLGVVGILVWEQLLELRILNGLCIESKDRVSYSEENSPELKFGSPQEVQYQDTFFRAL